MKPFSTAGMNSFGMLPPTTFELPNDENLEELDLDAPRRDLKPKNANTAPASKPINPPNANRR